MLDPEEYISIHESTKNVLKPLNIIYPGDTNLYFEADEPEAFEDTEYEFENPKIKIDKKYTKDTKVPTFDL